MALDFTTPADLENALRKAMEAMRRGPVESWERRDIVLALLVSLHFSDESGRRLAGPLSHVFEDSASARPLGGLPPGDRPALVRRFLLRAAAAVRRLDEGVQSRLMEAFEGVRLDFESLAYPEALGDAVESFLGESQASVRFSGEHYTPRGLVDLLTEIARPRDGMRIYDPFCGTGGMLLHAKRYVDAHGDDSRRPDLAGQDVNAVTAELGALNLYLNRIPLAALEQGDSFVAAPPGVGDVDLVLSAPPFGLHLREDQAQALDRYTSCGSVSERGPADWPLMEYMLRMVTRRRGSVCTVVSHGPLFRAGRDQAVRSALLDADVVEAVIGLAPNLFSSTAIAPCVLLLRAPGGKAGQRHGKVLFVDASREYRRGPDRNVMRSEHIERIVSAVRGFADVDRFARVVDRSHIAANGDILDIRRYVDSAPLPEPQSLQAHMSGGMPVAEIDEKKTLLDAYGIKPGQLFARRYGDAAFMDFLPPPERPDARKLTELAQDREQRLGAALGEWWERAAGDVARLAPEESSLESTDRRMGRLRRALLDAWNASVTAPGVLEAGSLSAAFTDWWHESGPQLRTFARRGRLLPPVEDLSALREGMEAKIDGLAVARRRELVETYERWQQKYGLSFREIESQLTGPSAGFVQNNPWSRRSAWDLSSMNGAGVADRRRQTAQSIYALTDTEKTVEGALAKLDVDELMALLPVLAAEPESEDEVDRLLLRDVVRAARTGTSGRLTEEPGGVPAVEARHLTERGFSPTVLRRRRADAPPRDAEMLVRGDVLLTARVMAGRGYRAIVWEEQLPRATYSGSVLRLTPDTERVLPGYLAIWLSHRAVHPRLYAQARQSRDALFDLPAGRLLNVEIELPSLRDQQRILDGTSALAGQRELRYAQLAKLDLIKRTMLRDLESDRTSVDYAS
ncbi:N-6 DNA methylase [Streptomyces sp. NPDC058964]|uniref:N-6 DNA methylase n=1 Tax=Streptomyces sp. NPDC058964 TaxID=3346681 RepID=UPI00369BFCB7